MVEDFKLLSVTFKQNECYILMYKYCYIDEQNIHIPE